MRQQLRNNELDDVGNLPATLEKAEQLYECAQLQIELQDFLRLALESRNPEELAASLQLIQDMNSETNDARREISLMLLNDEKLQNQAVSVRLNNPPLSIRRDDNATTQRFVNLGQLPFMNRSVKFGDSSVVFPGNNTSNRLSAVIDMSQRLSKLTMNGSVFGSVTN